jgi:hypothetical protein
VGHQQQKGKAHICNFQRQPMFTHCNQFLSDATCPGKRIDTSTTPVFGYAEKGRVRPAIERASKSSRPAVQGQPTAGSAGRRHRIARAVLQVSHWLPPALEPALARRGSCPLSGCPAAARGRVSRFHTDLTGRDKEIGGGGKEGVLT